VLLSQSLVEFKNIILFDGMKFSEEVGGYSRSINSHKRGKLNRSLIGPMYRALNAIGAMNLATWGFVAIEVYSYVVFAVFVAMLLMWMVALTPPVRF
jgi:hypothetical protein